MHQITSRFYSNHARFLLNLLIVWCCFVYISRFYVYFIRQGIVFYTNWWSACSIFMVHSLSKELIEFIRLFCEFVKIEVTESLPYLSIHSMSHFLCLFWYSFDMIDIFIPIIMICLSKGHILKMTV